MTELSNLCGLAQVRAVKKSCHAALVFSHKGQLKNGNGTYAKTKLWQFLNKMQEGKTPLIKKDGGEMLIAIVLDKPLSEAQALVDDPDAFMF